MTIPVSVIGSIVCLLLTIVIHQLIRLVSGVSALRTDAAVHSALYAALENRVKTLEHKSIFRSQTT